MKLSRTGEGFVAVIAAQINWGFLPLFWKLFELVPAVLVLAHRVLWSFTFVAGVVIVTGRGRLILQEIRGLWNQPRRLACALISGVIITGNWGLFIWAVNAGRLLESSLGYYICPLATVFLGCIFFQERLPFWRITAIFLAAAGVVYLAVSLGVAPWVSIFTAVTMSFYNLCKKAAGLGAFAGTAVETLVAVPLALAYFGFLILTGADHPSEWSMLTFLLLSGPLTVLPLFLLTMSLNRLPLSYIGLLQYINPTLTFLVGVYMLHEPFSRAHLTAFICIWTAVLLFMLSSRLPKVTFGKAFRRQ